MQATDKSTARQPATDTPTTPAPNAYIPAKTTAITSASASSTSIPPWHLAKGIALPFICNLTKGLATLCFIENKFSVAVHQSHVMSNAPAIFAPIAANTGNCADVGAAIRKPTRTSPLQSGQREADLRLPQQRNA
jgi:hypothetical protein